MIVNINSFFFMIIKNIYATYKSTTYNLTYWAPINQCESGKALVSLGKTSVSDTWKFKQIIEATCQFSNQLEEKLTMVE